MGLTVSPYRSMLIDTAGSECGSASVLSESKKNQAKKRDTYSGPLLMAGRAASHVATCCLCSSLSSGLCSHVIGLLSVRKSVVWIEIHS